MLQKQVREVNMRVWRQPHRWRSMSRDSEKFCKITRNHTTIELRVNISWNQTSGLETSRQPHWSPLLPNPLKLMTIFSEGKKMEISRESLDFSNSPSNTSELDVQLLFLNRKRNEQIYPYNLSLQGRDISACDSSPHEGCGHNCCANWHHLHLLNTHYFVFKLHRCL